MSLNSRKCRRKKHLFTCVCPPETSLLCSWSHARPVSLCHARATDDDITWLVFPSLRWQLGGAWIKRKLLQPLTCRKTLHWSKQRVWSHINISDSAKRALYVPSYTTPFPPAHFFVHCEPSQRPVWSDWFFQFQKQKPPHVKTLWSLQCRP